MVSVLLIIIDAAIPLKESGPKVLNMSRSIPVAAEEENIFVMLMGTSAEGNPVNWIIGDIILQTKSIAPDERKIPTAVINPISDGNIDAVVFNPSYAPEINTSKISTFFIYPCIMITTKIIGIVIFEM